MMDFHREEKGKNRQKRNMLLVGSAIVLVLMAVVIVGFIIERYTPTKSKMSGYEYFDVQKDESVLVVLNGESGGQEGIYDGGRLYLTQQYIADNLNQRFYFDEESSAVLFTDSKTIYTFEADSGEYTDSDGKIYTKEYNIIKTINEELYIDMEFVSQFTDLTYESFKEPERVVIFNVREPVEYVDVNKNTYVRYRGGIKSKVLQEVKKSEKLQFIKSVDDWTEVRTASGYTGYLKSDSISEVYTETPESVYKEDFSYMKKDYKISLAWFQVTNKTANNNIDGMLAGTSGITTISPTWYAITSNSGDMTSLASADFVNNMHARGYEVWPLIDDFDKNLNGEILYKSKAARTKMIQTLINDAKNYGYDGLNLDCEKVTKDGVRDFLQFVRELSMACRKNNIVLSIDNYKPASFNKYYDLEEQGAFADYIVIMGYDEHYAGSESGSVASIGFVEEGISEGLKQVPKERLINAIPFYTRIWTVASGNTTSKAVGMQAAIDDLNANGVPIIWDESVGQYFGSYEKEDGSVVKIWVEEDRSVEEKMKVITNYDLAGVAQWKLGLEKKSVWSVISKYNK